MNDRKLGSGDPPIRKFRSIFWAEAIGLTVISLVFIMPLAFGVNYFSSSSQNISLYYCLSMTVIAASQIAYLMPFKNITSVDIPKFALGMIGLIIVLYFWVFPGQSFILEFSRLEADRVFGPLVISIAFPVMQAFVNYMYIHRT